LEMSASPFWLVSMLMRLDLPTLERPMNEGLFCRAGAPGVLEMSASPFWLVSMLMRLDLPTLERPMNEGLFCRAVGGRTGRLGDERESLLVGEHVDEARLAHVGAADERDLRPPRSRAARQLSERACFDVCCVQVNSRTHEP
jgi:hypothetical protein